MSPKTTRQRRAANTVRALTAAALAGVGVIAADVPTSVVASNQLRLATVSHDAVEPSAADASILDVPVHAVPFSVVTAAADAASPVHFPVLVL